MTAAIDRQDLRVEGMDCASCAATIEAALRKHPAVRDVQVNVVAGTVRVMYASGKVAVDGLERAITGAGYHVIPAARPLPATARGLFSLRSGRPLLITVSGLTLLIGLLLEYLGGPHLWAVASLTIATTAGAWYVVPRGLRAARTRSLDMNALMTIAVAGAWIIGDHGEAAATIFLFAVAELLESYSMDRARNAIKLLMDLSPVEARVRRGGLDQVVPAEDVKVGEKVLVRPGEKLPVDGMVVEGHSSVNQAPITGESMPVDKEKGATVFAGTLNGEGALVIESTRPATDSTLSRIVHAVEEAQVSRAPSQRFVDRFARVYTPAVVVGAIAVAVLPPALGAGGWGTWIYRALTLLVIACPCALVISTPVSIVSGLTAAARAGVLIKGGAFLEQLARIKVVALDKTGTLTEGRPAVTDVVPLDGTSETELLDLVAAVEYHSEHPLATAVRNYAISLGLNGQRSSDFQSIPGMGAHAKVGDSTVYVGNARLAKESNVVSDDIDKTVARFQSEGKTAVIAFRRSGDGSPGVPVGVIAIADRPRDHARNALAELRELGARKLVMLTGDNLMTAQAVARAVGVDDVRAELLPEEKVRVIRELEIAAGESAFVGDGINDAPALASASVGIAMGAAGTDVALETADVALMGDDLSAIPRAIRISQKTLGIVRQNIVFSLAIKVVFLALAVAGWATLWMAVGADMGGSLIVVANGLRARSQRSAPRAGAAPMLA